MTTISDERLAKPYVKRNAPGHDGDGGEVVVPFETDAEMRRILSSLAAPVSEETTTSARFARLNGICSRIKWEDECTPALGDEQTKQALGELAEFLFADAIDATLAAMGGQ